MESDEALHERLVCGDMAAFDALYARYERPLFGFLCRQLRDPQEAEDVYHEAFLAVLHERSQKPAPRSFRAWIFQVARNLCLNRARARRRGERAADVEASAGPDSDPAPDRQIERHEAARALSDAVGRLPPALAELYALRTAGLSYDEIADVLGVPLGTVKSRMHELVSRLKEEMTPWTAH